MAQYDIISYCMDDHLPTLQEKDLKKFTILNIAFGLIVDGKVDVSHLKNLSVLPSIRMANPKLSVVLSIGGWGAGGFSEAAATQSGRTLFAQSAIEIMKAYDLDGIDIDWEYPCHHQADIASDPNDKYTYTLLIKELRETIDRVSTIERKYLLSIAAGADQYWLACTEMEKVQAYLDYVQLMTYDMRGGFQCLTGHHTGLFNSTGDLFRISADASAQAFHKAGVPWNKLILGAAFYARAWTGVPNHHNGLFVLAESTGKGFCNYATLAEKYIDKDGYVRHWDDEAKAPYLFNGNTFVSYDDPVSLVHKCHYIQKNKMRGLMYWAYHVDPTDQMIPAIYDTLSNI